MLKQNADRIITEYLTKIYGFAVKHSFLYDEAEDLCSDIVCELYNSLLKADEIFNVDGYVYRICRHVYSRFVAKCKLHSGVSLDNVEIPFEQEFFSDETDEELSRLRREIAYLTRTRREIVYSFYFENESVSGIAKRLAMPEGTVKWHLNKARNNIKKGINMERKIGKLGLCPVEAVDFGHSGSVGTKGGPEYYLGDKISLNIVYSVYRESRTKEEIAEELGLTPVFIEDKIALLEENGYLVPKAGGKYTTYVYFKDVDFSLEEQESILKKQLEVSSILADKYVPLVREVIDEMHDVYVPGGNRELFEAAAVFCAVLDKCNIDLQRDISKYMIKSTDGGAHIATVQLVQKPTDPDFVRTVDPSDYWVCGSMTRASEKYPSVRSWSADSRFSSREGAWKNNLTSDYEYLYEFVNGWLRGDTADGDKLTRLRDKRFITDDGKVNVVMARCVDDDFYSKLPSLSEDIKKCFADYALECALANAKKYPPQMQDLIVKLGVVNFIGTVCAVGVLDILYSNGTFKPLKDNERSTSNIIMFSDIIPE